MKVIAFLLLAYLCVASRLPTKVGSIEMVNMINSANLSWKAEVNEFLFKNPSSLMGYVPLENDDDLKQYQTYKMKGLSLPQSFDSRQQWSNCQAMFDPLDQGDCGSCWAFGCVKSLSQRFCVASNGSFNLDLSEQQMVSCNLEGLESCAGGEPITAFRYAAEWGLPLSSCVPYVSGVNGTVPSCASQCVTSSQPWNLYFDSVSSITWHVTIEGMMESIITEGPVEACFTVYQDFMSYKSGVYQYATGDALGGHCIVLIGWGTTQDGVDYWIAQNSWSKSWGMDGFFWIKRGVDECGIEWRVFSALPY